MDKADTMVAKKAAGKKTWNQWVYLNEVPEYMDTAVAPWRPNARVRMDINRFVRILLPRESMSKLFVEGEALSISDQ